MPPNTNTEIALIKQAMDFQNKEISEIKKILLEFIDSANDKFATKEEHKANKVEIELIKSTHSKVISWLIGTVATIFVTFLWLIIKTLWIK